MRCGKLERLLVLGFSFRYCWDVRDARDACFDEKKGKGWKGGGLSGACSK